MIGLDLFDRELKLAVCGPDDILMPSGSIQDISMHITFTLDLNNHKDQR